MSAVSWFRAPRHWLILFLLVTLAPSSLLVWLGWRLLDQDRSLELQRAHERRERAADLIVAGLEQSLSADEQRLADAVRSRHAAVGDDAVIVAFTSRGVEAYPKNRLLYYPSLPASAEAPSRLPPCEEPEFRRNDPAAAIACFAQLARSPQESIRAAAQIGLARNLRKAGRFDAALAAYQQTARLRGPAPGGVPLDLFARWARCDLLSELKRAEELRRETIALQADLEGGHWQLTRAVYEFHAQEVSRWTGVTTDLAPERRALAATVEWLWKKWQVSPAEDAGRQSVQLEGLTLTLLWRKTPEHLTALIAGPRYVEQQWFARLEPLLQSQSVRVLIRDAAPDSQFQTRRPASLTGLPWPLLVESLDAQGDQQRLAARRRLLVAALALLALLLSTGSYFIWRAVARELAVARLQSDFVAAVSHEFRTPLTSLCQLTEILSENRVATDDRRHAYYQALARQTQRLRRLVEGLLDFGRMEAGMSSYRFAPLDAGELVRAVVDDYGREIDGTGYRIELSANGAGLPMQADREALTRAVWNLLDNAVKYSPECHTVWVDVAAEPGHVAIRVRDRGLGIPLDEQTQIFRKFVRGAAARAVNIKGTGIGLAMVDHIVRAHAGEVSVESAPGAGSTFTVRLPLCRES